jgi:hypothetical protein
MLNNNITVMLLDDPAFENTDFAPRFKVCVRNEELNQHVIFGEGYTYEQAKNVQKQLLKVYVESSLSKAANK